MGYENLYGIGRGAAQVWGQNVGLSMLQQSFDQDKKRKEKEDADIQAEMAKVNYDGVRQADIPHFAKRYEEIKNLQKQLSVTSNKTEAAQLRANFGIAKQKMFSEIAQSKQEGQTWGELGKLKFTKPDELSDSFTPDYLTGNNLSTFAPEYKGHVEKLTNTMFSPSFDAIKLNSSILDKSIKPIVPTEKQVRKGTYTYIEKTEGTELDPNLVVKNLELAAVNDKKILRAITRAFPDLKPDDAVKAYAEQLVKDNTEAYRKLKTQELGGQHDVRPTWSDLHPKAEKTDGEKDANYRYNWAKDMIQGVPGSGEQLKAILAGAGGYEKELIIKTNGNKIVFHVPKRSVTKTDADGMESTITYPARPVTIDKADPNAIVTLNRMVSDITGEKVQVSKLLTEAGRGKGKVLPKPTGQSNTTNNSGSATKIVTYVVDGTEYNIPSDKVGAFLKAKPKAKKK